MLDQKVDTRRLIHEIDQEWFDRDSDAVVVMDHGRSSCVIATARSLEDEALKQFFLGLHG